MIGWFHRLFRVPNPSDAKGAVQVVGGGIAAGRDIRDSTIRIGVDEKVIERRIAEAQRPLIDQVTALADQVAREKGVPVAPLRTILVKLGEIGVPDHEILRRLDLAADQLIELRTKFTRSSVDRPEFAALRQHVLRLLESGDLDGARGMLQRGREGADARRSVREQVELIANEGLVDQLQLNYRDAARKYAEAAHLVGTIDPDGVWGLLMHQADTLAAQGAEFAENAAFSDAIAIYKRCLTLAPRPKRPLDWAHTQNSLGVVLSRLGARESTTDSLRAAVEAYNEALKECTRERAPADWAATKNNLGNVLTELGQREGNIGLLESAVVAYAEALQECKRERVPLEWANIQCNLGTTLQTIGKNEAGTSRLEQSVECYKAALTERTRDRVPLDWAMTQNNLGNTLLILSRRERSVDRLKASINCFLEALRERTIERVPLDWAMTASNLGMALVQFGDLEGNPHRIQSGIDCLREAQLVFEQAGADRYAVGNEMKLAGAESILSECRKAADDLPGGNRA
jgi:tetratricopeptide (TPR) repeat protein